ncbi:anthranilate phosphoribosyltransferase [Oleiphilus sp. HI0068]|jgi:anthranilate phosphoribosyltransferase|uniref:anthranilate phosphoribosyltransferase n=1 Tax=unclassified Oleiphilus TaxID=2631174 RepID=UPI0007C36A3C|nr:MULTISPECIES: anthranilate phosphoribosyltransferase [unclassified Oleiphilus]KZY73715.1 anthranilate phosphoribosyltransferase [Oleiphilus sp. HI0068]KZY77804.1 anthranilate phosphoribosyltransferase [Oleiphilus sp. HI0069]KZZ31185.1 anthranilate phosphoribosyltransferase [Oleiphilus sp. HI0085]KZY60393.1 anthranilate phosphoribosyltransferase [Oleiphilus sp. HI0061]KZZ73435.1 anthranilate phosphoribosyltransferase [Oleiphilus sp. HI0132]
MDITQALAKVVENTDLATDEMQSVMQQIMTGQATEAQIGGFLVALRMKGESIDEITGAAQVMRELSTKVDISGEHLVDTCGTGGDGANLFNVSTASAFVVAAAGGKVAKHGNRSVSSSTGSADVLEAAGINLSLSPEQVQRCIEEIGVGFMFAPAHHSAMKHAIGPRKQMAIRTIFNMLGPMTNPANVGKQVIGVFNSALCKPMAEVLKRLGSEHVLIVHASDGLDEITISGDSHVAELKDGVVSEYTIKPEDFDLARASLDGLGVDSAEQSLNLIKAALGKEQSEAAQKARSIITLNAGAAIYASDLASSLAEGVELASDSIGSGVALAKLNDLASFTRVFAE